MCRNILLFCTIILCGSLGTAQKNRVKYDDLKKEYSHFPENDAQALPFIAKSIASAKKTDDHIHLLHAYEDAAFSSPDRLQKLKYADSCIQTAQKTQDATLISMAYLGKGIVYYFNFRKFDPALQHYLLAAKSAEKTQNPYLQYKIKYQIGVVKSYTGNTKDALSYFEECLQFFEKNLQKNLHPNERYNNTRGYLNTLHQMSICERQLEQYEKSQDLLTKAQTLVNQPDYQQEKGYYLKETGILAFQKKEYTEAIESLLSAEALLQQKKEDSHLSATYFYLGSSYLHLKEWEKAYSQLRKVDSLFGRNETISSEVLKTYALLLKNPNFQVSNEERNHYIDQLLIAERILKEEMPQLSARIHREYDTQILLTEKAKLEKDREKDHVIRTLLIGVGGSVLLFLIILWRQHREIKKRYRTLQEKLAEEYAPTPLLLPDAAGRKKDYPDAVVVDLLEKLQVFEQTTVFTDPDFTFEKLTQILDANRNHLSYVLNEHRQVNFSQYRAALHIHYMTQLMNSDPRYLKYTIEALAKMSGMKSRQQFNKFFKQFNKITPSQFIEQKNKDLLQS